MTEFTREDRYIVIKLKDLSHGQFDALERCFRSRAITPVGGPLVVEQDWPEFEPTWKAIEERMAASQPAKDGKCVECNGLGKECAAGCNAHPSNWSTCEKCNGTGKTAEQLLIDQAVRSI